MRAVHPISLRSSFVGRDGDVAAVAALVESEAVVTITGPGGVGKTRLAARVGSLLAEEAGLEVATAALNDIDDAELVPDAVAAALGVVPRDGQPTIDALVSGLVRRQLILVLDNCEHVADACARLVGFLVEAAPVVRIVATSRQPLAIPGEQIWRLAPLACDDAVRLLNDRLNAWAPAANVDEAAAVALVDRLDRLPLAIEIAAGRVAALGVSAVLERVDDQLRLLSGGFRTSPPHHHGLEATMAWSYDHLDDSERVVLRRLAVFAGGFTIEAAEAIVTCDGPDLIDERTVARAVANLVSHSLVEPASGEPARHRLLETVRAFAADRLERAGEAEALRRAHFDWYCSRAQSWGTALRTAEALAALAAFDAEDANLRAAMGWARGSGDVLRLAELACTLWLYWWLRGRHEEGVGWLEWLVTSIPETAPAGVTADLSFALAFLVPHLTGDWGAGIPHAQRAFELAPATSEVSGRAQVALSQCLANTGDPQQAAALAARGLAVGESVDDPWLRCYGAWNLGMAQYLLGDRDAALDRWVEVCARARSAGIGHALLIGLQTLAGQSELRGDVEGARAGYEEALHLRRELGARRLGHVHGGLPAALTNCGRVAGLLGDGSAAVAYLEEAVSEARVIGDATEEAAAVQELGRVRPSPRTAELRREGHGWILIHGDKMQTLRDAKGLIFLVELLRRPGESVAAVELAHVAGDGVVRGSDAGPLADRTAIQAYRARLVELTDEADEARAHHDLERVAQADAELDQLTAELSRAVGYGGRERRAGSTAERARLNVTRAVRRSINEISKVSPALGSHLAETVRTGSFCSYEPGPAPTIQWAT